MANRYWVGGNAIWDSTAGTKWSLTSGGAGGQAVPTASDDVFLDNGTGTGNVALGTGYTALAKTLTCTGYVGTLSGSGDINISGSVTLVAGMTITATGTMAVIATATLTSNGKTWTGNLAVSGNTTRTFADAWTVSLDFGNFSPGTGAVITGQSVNVGRDLTCTGAVGGTTNIVMNGSGTWSGSGILSSNLTINTAGDIIVSGTVSYGGNPTTGLTYTTANSVTTTSSTLAFTLGTYTLTTNGIIWNNITTGAGNTHTITLGNNLTCSGSFTVGSNQIVTMNSNTFNIGGGFINSGQTTNSFTGTTSIVLTGSGIWSSTHTTGRIANNFEIAAGAGTVTISGGIRYSTGILKYTSGTLAGASSPALNFVTTGPTWTNNATFTLTTLAVTSTVAITFNGTNGFSISSFTCTTAGLTFTFAATKTYTLNSTGTQLTLTGTNASRITFVSSTGASQAIFTLLNNGGTQDVGFVNATDIDSSAGQTVWDWGGTLSNATNWNALTTPKTVGYASVV